MENSKAYNILKTFKPKEIIGLSKFLNSPYFNESKNVKKLFEIIRQYYPQFSHPDLNTAELHLRIFKNKEHHISNSVNNLFTKLIKLAEKYLSINTIINDKLILEKYLLSHYLNRNNRTYFEHKYTKYISGIAEDRSFDPPSYLLSYQVKNFKLEFLIKDIYAGKKKLTPVYLSNNSKDLCNYYYVSICRDYLRFLKLCSVTDSNWDIHSDKELYENIVNNIPHEIENDLLKLYKKFITIYTSPVKPDFIDLKYNLLYLKKKISKDDKILLWKILFLYGKMLYDNGNNSVRTEVMALLKELTAKNGFHGSLFSKGEQWSAPSEYSSSSAGKFLLNLNGRLSEHIFNSIVRFTVEVNEFEWAEKFIYENYELVDTDEKQNVLFYNLAVYYFFKTRSNSPVFNEDYEKALRYLSKPGSHFPLKKLSIYRLMMMIYIETNQTEYFYYLYDSMIHYLKEHKNTLSDKIYLSNLNFAKITYNFCKVTETKCIERITNLDTEITNIVDIEEKKWIYEKSTLLKKKY